MNYRFPEGNLHKFSLRLLYWLLALSVLAMIVSYTDPPIRLLYILTLLWALFTGLLFGSTALRTIPWVRYTVLTFVLLVTAWYAFAGKPVNTLHLRRAYIARLRAFTGVHYLWGGESHLAIDCSGLARVALWEAMLTCGVTRGNPRWLGVSCWSFWWHDVGARDIEDGSYGYTHVIGSTPQLAGYDTSALQPGDMAVATHSHVLIFLGGNRWIEANPVDGKVVINPASPATNRIYFHLPVTLVRWQMLSQ